MTTTFARATTPCRRVVFAAIAALAPAMLMAQPPSAPAPEAASVRVAFGDLDLTTTAGQLAAKSRLSAAAQHLCNSFSDSRKVDDRANTEGCYRDTMGTALRQLSAQIAAAAPADSQLAQNRP